MIDRVSMDHYSMANTSAGDYGESVVQDWWCSAFKGWSRNVVLYINDECDEISLNDIYNNSHYIELDLCKLDFDNDNGDLILKSVIEIKSKNVNINGDGNYSGHLYNINYGKKLLHKYLYNKNIFMGVIGVDVKTDNGNFGVTKMYTYDLDDGLYISKGMLIPNTKIELKNNVLYLKDALRVYDL